MAGQVIPKNGTRSLRIPQVSPPAPSSGYLQVRLPLTQQIVSHEPVQSQSKHQAEHSKQEAVQSTLSVEVSNQEHGQPPLPHQMEASPQGTRQGSG